MANIPSTMDYDDGKVVVDAGPAYNVSAWRTHTKGGAQCSQAREFCYLCSFAPSDDPDGQGASDEVDSYTAICNVIRTLVTEQPREMRFVVEAVHQMYEQEVRPELTYEHPVTGAILASPAWSMASIERHILYSGMCPEIHDSVVDHIFESIIHCQNNTLKDNDTNRIIEEERKNFMDTMKHYTAWRKFRAVGKANARLGKTKS